MKYIRTKTVTTKLVDEYIDDLDIIKSIIKIICDKSITCSITTNSDPTLYPSKILSYNDDSITFQVNRQCTLKKSVTYKEIDKLEIDTSDTVLASKEGVSRWMLLDPSSNI